MKTKQKIIEAAIATFSTQPNASMATIAEAAGITRVTVHRHFSHRDQLISAVDAFLIEKANAVIDQILETSPTPLEQLKAITHSFSSDQYGFQSFIDQHDHHHEDHDPECCRFGYMNRKIFDIIDQLIKQNLISKELPKAWVFHHFNGVLYSAKEARRSGTVAPRDIPKLAWLSFSKGVIQSQNEKK